MTATTYSIPGINSITLTDQDFIGEGGEGRVYGRDNLVYKIYFNHSKMIPAAKLDELEPLTASPSIVAPLDPILDSGNRPVGYTMEWVQNAEPICKLFTNSFRKKANIENKSVGTLINNLIETIYFIHQNRCLIVDGNEFNFLVDSQSYTKPYCIDVDSYQTPSFPATAIMPYVKDPLAGTFTTQSDWFTFAILACQLFVGIHPFKGKHPGYKKNDIEKRMRDHVSIFNKETSLPKSARDFGYIPSHFHNWFIDLFEKGKRTPPPQSAGLLNVRAVTTKLVNSTQKLEISSIKQFTRDIRDVIFFNNIRVVYTTNKIYIQNRDYDNREDCRIIFSPRSFTPIAAAIQGNRLKLTSAGGGKQCTELHLAATNLLVYDNILFTVHHNKLTEIIFHELGDKIISATGSSWDILPNSTRVFDNMLISNALGKTLVIIPKRSAGGKTACLIKHIPELDEYKILEARHQNGVIMCSGHKNREYHRLMIRIDDTFNYDFKTLDNINQLGVNFVTLDNGTVVTIIEDGLIELCKNTPGHQLVQRVEDPAISTNMTLCTDAHRVMFFEESKLYSLRLRQ